MTQMLIHVGPFKTGTTSFQDYMWHHREALLKESILYPKAGIYSRNFGARHLHLARGSKNKSIDEVYELLMAELAGHPTVDKVVLSSERFSQCMEDLVARRKRYEHLNPKIVVVVRDEVTLVRSMYLQIVKSRFQLMKKKQATNLDDFARWFEGYKHKLCYPRILQPWIDAFGADRVIFVPYEAHKGVNIITALSDAMSIPQMPQAEARGFQNPSIGGLAATATLLAARKGPKEAKRILEFFSELEAEYPQFKKMDPVGFDPEIIRAYYDVENAPAFQKYPAFKVAHDAAVATA